MRIRHTFTLVALFSILTGMVFADSRVRKVYAEKDQIVNVRTAIGVATIIQVPDKPNSVIVGDMNAFKVEYLDTAITIKPLSSRAKSNLYIYTDYRRFNVQLVTGAEASADYVVYLENQKPTTPVKRPRDRPSSVRWKDLSRTLTNETMSVTTSQIGKGPGGVLFIDFTLKSSKSEKIDPASFWVTQESTTRTIHGLILSSLSITSKAPVRGTIEILRSDLIENKSLRFELRRRKTSFLTIQGAEWNQ